MDNTLRYCLTILAGLIAATSTVVAQVPQPVVDGQPHFKTNVAPFLEKFCIDCHSGDSAEGGVNFEPFQTSSNIQEEYELWEKVRRAIQEKQMPPADSDQPGGAQLVKILDALSLELASFDCGSELHPGRVTIRRLNRAEYNNTIRDLLGLELNLSANFPADDVGNGFDNIGDVLTIPPVLFEKYLDAAETIADRAFADETIRKHILRHEATSDDKRLEVALRNVQEFTERAYRRPVSDEEMVRLTGLITKAWNADSKVDEIFKFVVTAVLTNPNFLFRVEQDPAADDADGIRELDGFEIASRLSYFLWSSMPDEELFQLARSGELTKPDVIRAQAVRMLADPKASALVDNFAGQWLQLRDVPRLTPDPETFPNFDRQLQLSMKKETELFFANILAENRSVLEFLTADYTFMDQKLAEHYGVDNIQGDQFQRTSLPAGRRGVLTHASILMITSNPTRTSPVKRGKWILDNILAEPPPPPPPNVPVLEEKGDALGSLREQMEQHRANPSCAVCHIKMDALGFGLENFSPVGGWRDRDGRYDIDASGALPGGKNFAGAAELMQILATEKKEEFCRCLTQKLLTFALGRGLESYDRCAINQIVEKLQADNYRIHTLVTEIVTSLPFLMREIRRAE